MTTFLLEGGSECVSDYLELSDVSGYSSGRLCGSAGSGYVHEFAESPVTVHFHTDGSGVYTGFSMHYEAVWGNLILCKAQAHYFCCVNITPVTSSDSIYPCL